MSYARLTNEDEQPPTRANVTSAAEETELTTTSGTPPPQKGTDTITVSVIRLGNEPKRLTASPTATTVAQLLVMAFPEIEGKTLRAVLNGSVIENSATLAAAGIIDDSFVHLMVSEPKTADEIQAEQLAEAALAEDDLRELDYLQQQQMQIQRELPPEGNWTHLLCGFLIGLIFGIISLLWLIQRGVSRKQKQGIGLGIVANSALTMYQWAHK